MLQTNRRKLIDDVKTCIKLNVTKKTWDLAQIEWIKLDSQFQKSWMQMLE